jgi:hypothetical protein
MGTRHGRRRPCHRCAAGHEAHRSRRPQPRGGVDGEGLDGVEGDGAGAQAAAAAVAFDLVAELGEFLEVVLQGAVADAELSGEVGGGAGAGG